MKLFKTLWDAAGSIQLTLVIIGLMVLDLVWGYAMLKTHNELFQPINDRGFIVWAGTWAKESLIPSLWLFLLVALIALLALNTFVCTTDRVITLIRFRNRFKNQWRFVLRFSPHIMHYGMLIMFVGYLFSYLFSGTQLGKVILEGKSTSVGKTRITLSKMDINYYEGDRMSHLKNRAIHIDATLHFEENGTKGSGVVSFNRPALFNGTSVHLRDFGPKRKNSSMDLKRRYIEITIKKDPGIKFYFTGMVFFIVGLLMYTFEKLSVIRPEKGLDITGMEERC